MILPSNFCSSKILACISTIAAALLSAISFTAFNSFLASASSFANFFRSSLDAAPANFSVRSATLASRSFFVSFKVPSIEFTCFESSVIWSPNVLIVLASALFSNAVCNASTVFSKSCTALLSALPSIAVCNWVCKVWMALDMAAFMSSVLTGLVDVTLSICSCRFLMSSS